MSFEPLRAASIGIDVKIVDSPWSSRRHGAISLDLGAMASIPPHIVRQITIAAKAAADAHALDGVRLCAPLRAMRPFLRGGWQFWHFGCVRRIAVGGGLTLPDGLVVSVGDVDSSDIIMGALAESLRAGIPICEQSWRDGFDFTRGAERWLSDFMSRGDLLVSLLEHRTIVAYGLLSVSGQHAVLEDVSALPGYAGRGFSEILLERIERLAAIYGFDALRATLMHSVPAVRRRLGQRLKAEHWSFDEAHFSLP